MITGLLIAVFHEEIATFFWEREKLLHEAFARRGMHLPSPIPVQTAVNFYFLVGLGIALLQAAKIWYTL